MAKVRVENLQLCWYCSKSTNNGCSWSEKLEPVEGWTAKPTKKAYGEGWTYSYKITACPEFDREYDEVI